MISAIIITVLSSLAILPSPPTVQLSEPGAHVSSRSNDNLSIGFVDEYDVSWLPGDPVVMGQTMNLTFRPANDTANIYQNCFNASLEMEIWHRVWIQGNLKDEMLVRKTSNECGYVSLNWYMDPAIYRPGAFGFSIRIPNQVTANGTFAEYIEYFQAELYVQSVLSTGAIPSGPLLQIRVECEPALHCEGATLGQVAAEGVTISGNLEFDWEGVVEFAWMVPESTAGVMNITAEVDPQGYLLGSTSSLQVDLSHLDRDEDGVIDDRDKKYFGSYIPTYNFGINIGMNYKQFDLTVSGYGAGGNKIYNGLKSTRLGGENVPVDVYESRWTGPGSTNSNPGANRDSRASNYYLENGINKTMNNFN